MRVIRYLHNINILQLQFATKKDAEVNMNCHMLIINVQVML